MQHPKGDYFWRGLHVVVINPKNGTVEEANIFDTYKSSERLEKFIEKEIPQGYVIAVACSDECSRKLSNKCKNWFS